MPNVGDVMIVDDREMGEHPEIPGLISVPVTVTRLDAGDYAFVDVTGELLGIERCEIRNLIQKLKSGELEDQLVKCERYYKTIILLIEGVYDRIDEFLAIYKYNPDRQLFFLSMIDPRTRYGEIKGLEIRLMSLGIEVIETASFASSMRTLSILHEQRTKPEESHRLFKKAKTIHIPAKYTTNPAVPKLMSLADRLPEKVAIRLIDKYTTIWNVINAPDEELLQIDGLGKGLIKKFKEGIGKS